MPLATAAATAEIGVDTSDYLVRIEAGNHALLGNEGVAATLRMYMQKKAWPVGRISVNADLHVDRDGLQYIRRTVCVDAQLEQARRKRLAEICERTPVTLFIKRGTRIETTMRAE
ncbi:OsmC family protein [Paraburkholderia domus]|uniref:OsmC family protein n=1 Tax=Paraburkholderia domus TaxID=2793075 RepID=UPI001B23EA70|nr:OsmC family protein [Paraburkholderia domus]CAE6822238.1 hypothetical protein R75483_06303 [Paraburkholderia domus]